MWWIYFIQIKKITETLNKLCNTVGPYVLFCVFECRNWRWLAAAISKLHSLMWTVSVMLSAVFFVERYINANYYYYYYYYKWVD